MINIQSYKYKQVFPEKTQRGRFYIDKQAYTILMPFQRIHIPFHALTIKTTKLTKYEENKKAQQQTNKEETDQKLKKSVDDMLHELRISFWTTENTFNYRKYPQNNQGQVFIKELVYRSKNFESLEDTNLLIKNLQHQAMLQNSIQGNIDQIERAQTIQAFIDIEPLQRQLNPIILENVRIRPSLSNARNVTGVLECHLNGFRYTSSREEEITVPFKAVRHFILQPPLDDIIGAVHLNLHFPIIVGRKRVTDVQFYREVPGAVESLENKRKKQLTSLDIEFETVVQKDRIQMNAEFEQFIKEVEFSLENQSIVFEKPIRSLGLEGNWNRARLFIQPTKNCFINVVESPFFIIAFNEIDVVCFERIMSGVKTFDLVFVYKNYEKGWVRVESIDRSLLETTQQWLNERNILFFQVSNTLMWKNMLFTITRDFKSFVHEGGWNRLMVDQVDHAQLHHFKDDGSSIFEPATSEGETSISPELPEFQNKEQNQYNVIWEEESISDICDSANIFGFNQNISDSEEDQIKGKNAKKLLKK